MSADDGFERSEEMEIAEETYFISNSVLGLVIVVIMATVPLLLHVSDLLYGNYLINYVAHGNFEVKAILYITLIVLLNAAPIYVIIKYRKKIKIFWIAPPSLRNKLYVSFFNLGLTLLFLSVAYFILWFFDFLHKYSMFFGFTLFFGGSYYFTGFFDYFHYFTGSIMLQLASNSWGQWLYFYIIPLFMVSTALLFGVFLYLKRRPKELTLIFTVGVTWLVLNLFYFIFHFYNFLSRYSMFFGYDLFFGAYYYTGISVCASGYFAVLYLLQSVSNFWGGFLSFFIISLFIGSIALLGISLYLKGQRITQ